MKSISILQKCNMLFGMLGLAAAEALRAEGQSSFHFDASAFCCGLIFLLLLVEFYKYFSLSLVQGPIKLRAQIALLLKFPLVFFLAYLLSLQGRDFILSALLGFLVLIPSSLALCLLDSH